MDFFFKVLNYYYTIEVCSILKNANQLWEKNEEKPCPICIQLKAQKRFGALLNHNSFQNPKSQNVGLFE